MAKYKNKVCLLCGVVYKPSSPKQKYCDGCKDEGRRIADRERDKIRNRKNNNYQEYTKYCKVCGKEFKTYYKKKLYCGSEECEKERVLKNSIKAEKNRNKKLKEKTKLRRVLNKKLKLEEISNHVSEFGYSLIDGSEYISSHKGYIKLKCPNGHEWLTTYHGFKDNKARCFNCYLENNYISKPEQMLREFFEINYPEVALVYNDREQIKPKELDLYFPEHKVAVEVCGLYWHSEANNVDKAYHYNKMIDCYNKGIRLLTVFEDELYNRYDAVISILLQALGLNYTKVYARKCVVKEISGKEANDFFDKYHIQGKSTALKAWSLFYKDELVSVCSVGNIIRKHVSTDDIIELKRFCVLPGLTIVGGASKLFKQVILYAHSNNYKFIKSYCDMRYSNIFNSMYEKIGFDVLNYTKYTPHYVKGGKRYRDFYLRKTPKEKLAGKTEVELSQEQGFFRIWDCGHKTYIYNV